MDVVVLCILSAAIYFANVVENLLCAITLVNEGISFNQNKDTNCCPSCIERI